MPVRAWLYTDPACSASWAAEPHRRRLMVEFGDEVEITYVMGGLAREYKGDLTWLAWEWLGRAEDGMPLDPRIWREGPIKSTYPACMAVKAAREQGKEGPYLRAVREGLMCFRRKLDTSEALVEEARSAGLDPARFRVDLGSHAIVEAFGADLEAARTVPEGARERGGVTRSNPETHGVGGERLVFPTLRLEGPGGTRWLFGTPDYAAWREAAVAAGATPSQAERPGVLDAVRRFGRMAAREVELVCDLPGPRAEAELWRLAADWRVRPLRVLTGWLFEPV
jgi:hypothetical protein